MDDESGDDDGVCRSVGGRVIEIEIENKSGSMRGNGRRREVSEERLEERWNVRVRVRMNEIVGIDGRRRMNESENERTDDR